jgi:hypothetical protein
VLACWSWEKIPVLPEEKVPIWIAMAEVPKLVSMAVFFSIESVYRSK